MTYMRQENVGTTEELGTPQYITCHWSAGTYGQTFDHYHLNIAQDGQVVQTRQITGPGSLGSHTWHRNTGNIGVGIDACYDDRYPVTPDQEESLARTVAELMGMFKIPFGNVVDHVHWASLDGYGPGSGDPETRVDLSGTDAGKQVWSRVQKRILELRPQLATGAIPNTLLGKIN